MKKKQFMSKLAALTMAAMMGLSAVPASAVSVLAKTDITGSDVAMTQTVTTSSTIDTSQGDGKAAVDAVKGTTGVDLSGVADDDLDTAKTKIGSNIKALINSSASPIKADVVVDTFKAAKGESGDDLGSMTGTATWSVPGKPKTDPSTEAGQSYYDIKVTVPFTVSWKQSEVSPRTQTWSVDLTKVTGTITTYTNSTNESEPIDAENLTTLQETVKNAIEGADTDETANDSKGHSTGGDIMKSAAVSNIIAAVNAATHYTVSVTSLAANASDPNKLDGTVLLSYPNPDKSGNTVYEAISFTTDKATARQKRVNQAAADVSAALCADSEYSVSTDHTIDKVIAEVLKDKGYDDVQYAGYTLTKNTATAYEGTFTVVMPEVKDASGKVTAAKVAANGTFKLGTGESETALTTTFLDNFTSAIKSAPMYDDTTADELTSYLNGVTFKVPATTGKTLKESHISASNVVINGVTDVAHGKPGTADVTITLTDASGKMVRQSYKINNVKHSDSTKLKEATDTIAAVSAKVDTSKAQKKTDTTALALGDNAVNTEFKYDVTKAGTGSVEALAQKVVKDSLNTVINASAASASRKKLDDDFSTSGGVDVTSGSWKESDWTYNASSKFIPTIKVTNYTKATSTKEGSATVEVIFRTPNDAYALDSSTGVSKVQSATAKFTLTFGKLKAKATKFIELGQTQYMTLFTVGVNGKATTTYSTKTLTATADGNDPITWTSSDPSVAIVDANGKVTAKGIGTATITATNANDTSVSDSVAVVIKNNDDYNFVDVQNPNMFYFSPVYEAVKEKVTAGTDATHFSPDASVTRAQFITWLYVKAGKPATTVTGQFTDVPEGKWYSDAVYWALENGITAGTTSTTFSPDQTLTRGQAMMFLYKALGKGQTYNRELALQFKDVSETSPFAEAINWGLNNKITNGYTTTQFGIDDACTRGQAITFLYKAL